MITPQTKTYPSSGKALDLSHSSIYQEFLSERDEILRLKWLESEKAGKDIGFEAALLKWVRQHRRAWRAARMEMRSGSLI
jgi:hypothetical protein